MTPRQWVSRGPFYDPATEGPPIYAIAYHPTNPAIVYAATEQGVYRSQDGAETWQPRNGGLGGFGDLRVMDLTLAPNNPDHLFIATWGYGVMQSTDAGQNWTRLADPVPAAETAVDQAGLEAGLPLPPEVRAGGAGPVSYAPPAPVPPNKPLSEAFGSLRPAPDSHRPQPETIPSALSWRPVHDVAVNPANPNELFASYASHGLYRSLNGGVSWTQVTGAGTGTAWVYAFAPSNPQVRYASFDSGVYRSIDGGASYGPVTTGLGFGVTALAVHPANHSLVLAGASDGLYRTVNAGGQWDLVSGSLDDPTGFVSVAFAPSDPRIVYAGSYFWVYQSADTGATWENADTELDPFDLQGLAIHPSDPQIVLLGPASTPASGLTYRHLGGVYKQTSASAPFALKVSGMTDTFVLDVAQDPANPNIVYAATWGAGIFRSLDAGTTWSALYTWPYVYDIELVWDHNTVVLYAATFYSDVGILRSDDRGASWYETSYGYVSDISFDLVAIDGGPARLVAATYAGVQYSLDGGFSWTTAEGLNQGIVLDLCQFPGSGRMLAATYAGGLWASDNYGVAWHPSHAGVPSTTNHLYTYDLACATGTPGEAYAGGLQVYRSSDYGANWTVIGTGLANDYVRGLALSLGTRELLAGTNASGVFSLRLGASTWSRLAGSLVEDRVRSLGILGGGPPGRLLMGTNGAGTWDYLLAPLNVFLPVTRR
jgi:photosystem II stability/assembly factor-like uncharacterized protein